MPKQSKDQKRKKKLASKQKSKDAAKQKLNQSRKQVPPHITCNDCGGIAPKESFQRLNTRGMEGIYLALTGTCKDCEAPTIAVSGEPEATAELMTILQAEGLGNGNTGVEIASAGLYQKV